MIRKYKIGNFTIEVRSQAPFQDIEPYSSFLYYGEQTDYCVNIDFSSALPTETEASGIDERDYTVITEDNHPCFYYKSHANKGYYARRTKKGRSIDITIDEMYRDSLWTRVIFSLLGIEELAEENNGAILHSSFIEVDGKAVLFTGPCSIGKSTQANLWRSYAGATVINGDKTFIFKEKDKFYASGLPYSGSSKDCLNKVLPLGAVIRLQQADRNTAKRLTSTDAFLKIFKNCYPVQCSQEQPGALIDFALSLSQSVPIYDYACLADESAVRYLERELCPILQSR